MSFTLRYDKEGPTMAEKMQHLIVEDWQKLVGTWATEATHPMLPGAEIRGESTFEWLEGRRFLIQRSQYDHPEIPDAIAIIGLIDEQLSMHYFDSRGVHRVLAISLMDGTLRFARNASAPDFSQRFTGVLSQDGNTITGQGELSLDGTNWEDDLAITYRRVR
jgi:hypothetical protein